MIPDFVARLRRAVGSEELLWLAGVSAVIVDDGRVLLVRSVEDAGWTIVNGILEPGEQPATGLCREVWEETALRVRVDELTAVTVSPEVRHPNGDRAQYLELTFRCTPLSGRARVNDEENHQVEWFPLDQLPELDERVLARIRRSVQPEPSAWFEPPSWQPPDEPAAPGTVTVVTITRGRPELLAGAMETVRRQRGAHVARHLFLVDDCADSAAVLAAASGDLVEHRMVPRAPGEVSGPERLARLRDLAAELADTRWITYLDDDNDWEPEHVDTLVAEALASGTEAVHSWRHMLNPDGTPYTEELFPWGADAEEMRREYWRRVSLGTIRPGSSVYRDDVATEVDGGEWLLSTELVRRTGFACELDEHDRRHRIGEDDKFLARLLDDGVPVSCTRRPTLLYSLGGDSNLRLRAT